MKWLICFVKLGKKISERLGAPEIFFIFAIHPKGRLLTS